MAKVKEKGLGKIEKVRLHSHGKTLNNKKVKIFNLDLTLDI